MNNGQQAPQSTRVEAGRSRRELAQQGGLADAGLAGHQHDGTAAEPPYEVEAVGKCAQLGVPLQQRNRRCRSGHGDARCHSASPRVDDSPFITDGRPHGFITGASDPVTRAFACAIGHLDDVLEHPSAIDDGALGRLVAYVARDQGPFYAEVVRHGQAVPQQCSRITTTAVGRSYRVADVAAVQGEELVQLVPDRDPPDEVPVDLADQEGRGHSVGREVDALAHLLEPLDIALPGLAGRVVEEEGKRAIGQLGVRLQGLALVMERERPDQHLHAHTFDDHVRTSNPIAEGARGGT